MKCEWVRENIVLQVYGELADDARHELEQHVARCADCAAELKAEQEFHALLAQDRSVEPSPNLVAASRMRLQEASGDGEARQRLEPAGLRSCELAASGAVLAGAGIGNFDSRLCRRSYGNLQALRFTTHHYRRHRKHGESYCHSHRSFDHRHQFHRAATGHQIRSASSTTPYRRRKRRAR